MKALKDLIKEIATWVGVDKQRNQQPNISPLDVINSCQPIVGTVNDWKRELLNPNLLQDAIKCSQTRSLPDRQGLEIAVPLVLRPGICPKGIDLRLQLLSLRIGEPEGPPRTSDSPLRQQNESQPLHLTSVVDKAAGMLLARILFPSITQPTLEAVTTAWACTSITKAAYTYISALRASLQSSANTTSDTCSSKASAASSSHWQQHLAKSWSTTLHLAQQYGEPAAVLALAGMAWATLQPSSYDVAQCLAALVPVLAGYSQTSRACATGAVTNKEEAWHLRHKWAAAQCAHLLPSELPNQPPLQPLVQTVQNLCICIGAMVADPYNPSSLPSSICGGGGVMSTWSAGGEVEGVSFWASASLGGGNKQGHTPNGDAASATAVDDIVDVVDNGIEALSELDGLLELGSNLQRQQRKQRRKKVRSGSKSVSDAVPLDTPSSSTSSSSTSILDGVSTSQGNRRSSGIVDSPSEWQEVSTSSTGLSSSYSSSSAGSGFNSSAAVAAAVQRSIIASTTLEGRKGENVEDEESGLALYGRGDHAHLQNQPLSRSEKIELSVRAAQLLYNFAPFLLLGTFLLLFANFLPCSPAPTTNDRQATSREQQLQQQSRVESIKAAARDTAWQMLLKACRDSGAAFIKWGQWSSTREDIFPEDFCRVLAELHDKAPEHSYEETRAAVEAAYGKTLEELFLTFEPNALASGSIAQVHKATMELDGAIHEVAVKVRHPGVTDKIRTDFQVLRPLAALTSRIRSLKGLNLEDSVSQFSHTMTAQTDLRVEAAHLRRFYRNFEAVKDAVVVPKPLPGYQTESVLIETFEPGRSVSYYIRTPSWMNTHIVALGVDTYLKMLLQDNFVHTDLHPGNILVRTVPRPEHAQHAPHTQPSQLNQDEHGQAVQIVLLDFGLAEELTPQVRRHFVGFLFCIASGDGVGAAQHLLKWSINQRCLDPAAFTQDIVEMFAEKCNVHAPEGIDLDAVMKAVLHVARKHEVSIDSNYAALVIGVCVIVGFATALDKRVNLMDAAIPCFLNYALTGRVAGRLYM